MVRRVWVVRWLLAGLVALSVSIEARAQDTLSCSVQLASAEVDYQNGAFQSALQSATECLSRPTPGSGETLQAYRMLALTYIKLNDLEAARRAIVNLLGLHPEYTADRVNDPPTYAAMVSLVRRRLQLGPSAVVPQTLQSLSPAERVAIDVQQLRSIPGPLDPPSADNTFFRQANTWLTIGGIMIGGSAQSGRHSKGIGVGVVGVGAGGAFTGLGVGGLLVGGGDALEGIMVSGLVVGSGDRMDGIAIGGGGVGTGGRMRGLAIGGLGVGSGKAIRGIAVGGLGVGTGGDLSGIGLGLLGVGGRGSVTGFTMAGVGVGAGSRLRGLHIAGGAIVAPRLAGVTLSGVMVGRQATGGVIAPVYARIRDGGHLTGASVSLFNHVQGDQRGVTIGLFNVARSLHGVQLGALNYAGNNPLLLRLLPLINLNL